MKVIITTIIATFISGSTLYVETALSHGVANWRTVLIGAGLAGVASVVHYYQGINDIPPPKRITLPE